MTINSGRVPIARTIITESLLDYFDQSDQASFNQDQPKVLLVENKIVYASSMIAKLKSHGVQCDFSNDQEEAISRVQMKYKSPS